MHTCINIHSERERERERALLLRDSTCTCLLILFRIYKGDRHGPSGLCGSVTAFVGFIFRGFGFELCKLCRLVYSLQGFQTLHASGSGHVWFKVYEANYRASSCRAS